MTTLNVEGVDEAVRDMRRDSVAEIWGHHGVIEANGVETGDKYRFISTEIEVSSSESRAWTEGFMLGISPTMFQFMGGCGGVDSATAEAWFEAFVARFHERGSYYIGHRWNYIAERSAVWTDDPPVVEGLWTPCGGIGLIWDRSSGWHPNADQASFDGTWLATSLCHALERHSMAELDAISLACETCGYVVFTASDEDNED